MRSTITRDNHEHESPAAILAEAADGARLDRARRKLEAKLNAALWELLADLVDHEPLIDTLSRPVKLTASTADYAITLTVIPARLLANVLDGSVTLE